MSNLPTLSLWCTIAQSHTGAVHLQQWCNNIYIYIKKKIRINQNISPTNNNNNSKNKIILNNKTILSQKRLVLAKLSRDLEF